MQLSDEFEKLGTVFSISSDHDKTVISILTLKEYLARSLELLSNILFQPRFEEFDFEREKKKTLHKILQLKDEPSFVASSAFERRVFRNTFYDAPEIGFERNIESITNTDVKNFYQNNFLGAGLKTIIVGSLSESEAEDMLNKNLGRWQSLELGQNNFIQPSLAATEYFIIDKKDSAQSELRIGHIAKKRNSEDHFAARIMNTILGGQFSSRINLNLRERKGFTYGAGSAFHYYKESAMFQVSTAVNIENTGESIKEILSELNGILQKISSEEIDFAKSYLIKQFPARFETFPQIAKNIESLIIHSLPLNELNLYTSKIEQTSEEEIRKAGPENIKPDKLVILAVGDKKKLLPQIKEHTGNFPIELDIDGNQLM